MLNQLFGYLQVVQTYKQLSLKSSFKKPENSVYFFLARKSDFFGHL